MKTVTFFLIFSVNFLLSGQERNVFDIARTGTVEELQGLMNSSPALINGTNENGFSPLIIACYRGNVAVAEFLISHVEDVNYVSPEGTALAALSVRYNRGLVEALLSRKADPNIADASGTTPLIWAVKTGNEELAKLLLTHHAKADQPDSTGTKPFEYAIQTQKQNIINLLKNN